MNGYVMRALGPVLIVAALAILGARLEGGHRKSHTPVNTSDVAPTAVGDVTYVCPMDPDVRSRRPGTCQRCGMKLQAGVPDPAEFHLDLTVRPHRPEVGQRTSLRSPFTIPGRIVSSRRSRSSTRSCSTRSS